MEDRDEYIKEIFKEFDEKLQQLEEMMDTMNKYCRQEIDDHVLQKRCKLFNKKYNLELGVEEDEG